MLLWPVFSFNTLHFVIYTSFHPIAPFLKTPQTRPYQLHIYLTVTMLKCLKNLLTKYNIKWTAKHSAHVINFSSQYYICSSSPKSRSLMSQLKTCSPCTTSSTTFQSVICSKWILWPAFPSTSANHLTHTLTISSLNNRILCCCNLRIFETQKKLKLKATTKYINVLLLARKYRCCSDIFKFFGLHNDVYRLLIMIKIDETTTNY